MRAAMPQSCPDQRLAMHCPSRLLTMARADQCDVDRVLLKLQKQIAARFAEHIHLDIRVGRCEVHEYIGEERPAVVVWRPKTDLPFDPRRAEALHRFIRE